MQEDVGHLGSAQEQQQVGHEPGGEHAGSLPPPEQDEKAAGRQHGMEPVEEVAGAGVGHGEEALHGMDGRRGRARARRVAEDVEHHGQEIPVVDENRDERSRQAHREQGRHLSRARVGSARRLARGEHGHEQRDVDDSRDVGELASGDEQRAA